MAIVIKEIVVKTTVERTIPQWSQPSDEIIRRLKREILAELAGKESKQSSREGKKNR